MNLSYGCNRMLFDSLYLVALVFNYKLMLKCLRKVMINYKNICHNKDVFSYISIKTTTCKKAFSCQYECKNSQSEFYLIRQMSDIMKKI